MPRKNPLVPALSSLAEHRLRIVLRLAACSEPWVDAQIKTVIEPSTDGAPIVCQRYDPRVFPPGGRADTPMRWCRRCGRYTPAHAMHLIESRRQRGGMILSATLQCDDCRIGLDERIHAELYEALPNLRPAGTMSFVLRRQLYAAYRRGGITAK